MEIAETHRRRLWALCYRLTGDRASADDALQDALTRAVEKREDARGETHEGWLVRIATTVCLDRLRRRKTERAAVALVDPIALADAPFSSESNPEETLLRREDLRFAMTCCLQALSPRLRAVLVLRDVLGFSTEDAARAVDTTPANVKVMLHRARKKLEEAHRIGASDAPVDASLVEAMASCLERADIDGLAALLADDVWGLVDDGAGRRKPTLGQRAVARQWHNAFGKYVKADRVARVRSNGEPALVVFVAGFALAWIHVETRRGRIVALRVILDPARLARFGI